MGGRSIQNARKISGPKGNETHASEELVHVADARVRGGGRKGGTGRRGEGGVAEEMALREGMRPCVGFRWAKVWLRVDTGGAWKGEW